MKHLLCIMFLIQTTDLKRIYFEGELDPPLQFVKIIFNQIWRCEFSYIHVGETNTNFSDSGKTFHHNKLLDLVGDDSAGVYSSKLELNGNGDANITPTRFPQYRRFSDIHKLGSQCGFAFFSFGTQKIMRSISTFCFLFDIFTPRFQPILKKDEDLFVFLANNEKLGKEILLSPAFGNKIKFKLALFQTSGLVHAQTVDIYGNNGYPVIKSLFHVKNLSQVAKNTTVADWFPDMTKDFQSHVFNMAIPKVAFRFEVVSVKGRLHPRRGYYKWWLDEAIHKFNFSYNMFQASFGGSTGKLLENGTWIGALGDILNEKADWAFVVGHTYQRHPFLEWSGPLSYEWMVFLNHKPKTFYSLQAIFWPFTKIMWGMFFVTMVLVLFTFKVLLKLVKLRISYGTLLEYVFATILEQDRQEPCKALALSSIRLLVAFWLLFAIILTTAYKGKLVSLMAFPVETWVPNTFKELANSNFRVGFNVVGKGGAPYAILALSQSPVYKTLFKRMEIYPDGQECLLKAIEIDLSCIMWEGVAAYISARNLSNRYGHTPLQSSSDTTSFIADGLVWEKRAIFRKHLDKTIWAAFDMGLTIRWFQLDIQFLKNERLLEERRKENALNATKQTFSSSKSYMENRGPEKLKLTHFKGVLYILVGGLFVSALFFIVEMSLNFCILIKLARMMLQCSCVIGNVFF